MARHGRLRLVRGLCFLAGLLLSLPTSNAQAKPAASVSGASANVVISRLELRPAAALVGSIIECRIFYEPVPEYQWSLDAQDGIGPDYIAPEPVSVSEASQAGKPYLLVTCIAWQTGRSWLLLPDIGPHRFPPVPLDIATLGRSGQEPEVQPQAELPGFRRQFYLLMVAVALLLLAAASVLVLLPSLGLRQRRWREARRALRQLEKGLQRLSRLDTAAMGVSAAWHELDKLVRSYTQERLQSLDYRFWHQQQLQRVEGSVSKPPEFFAGLASKPAVSGSFVPALSARELAALPETVFPGEALPLLSDLAARCADVCWSGRTGYDLAAAIELVRQYVASFNAALSRESSPPAGSVPFRNRKRRLP